MNLGQKLSHKLNNFPPFQRRSDVRSSGIPIFFRPLHQFQLHTSCYKRLGNIKCQSFHFWPTNHWQCTKTKSKTNIFPRFLFKCNQIKFDGNYGQWMLSEQLYGGFGSYGLRQSQEDRRTGRAPRLWYTPSALYWITFDKI